MRVAVTGATGFIGARLIDRFDGDGTEYVIVTRDTARARQRYPRAAEVIGWAGADGPGPDPAAFEELDAVVHMAGEPVAQRWTRRAMDAIESSRKESTRTLVEALDRVRRPPPVLVSFSAIGYYGPRDDSEIDETSPPGSDFLAGVCRSWEDAAARARTAGIRVVTPRVGVVIGRGGGALAKMLLPFRLGLGGPIGNGRQWMSWIHVDDVVGIAVEAIVNPRLDGPVNATAPAPVTNRDFSKALGRALHRPALLPIPVLGLKLMYGGFADILATGQKVLPRRALEAGYRFRFTALDEALRDGLG